MVLNRSSRATVTSLERRDAGRTLHGLTPTAPTGMLRADLLVEERQGVGLLGPGSSGPFSTSRRQR
jgi:hypothetical protein